MKTCSRCRVEKPYSEFGIERATHDGYKHYCKPCCAEYAREHRRRRPEMYRGYEQARLERHGEKRREADRKRWAETGSAKDRESRRRFASKVRAKYGLTLEEYDAIVASPCGICGATGNVVLDHCHSTGVIRGALCWSCNIGLGDFADDPARLNVAAEYLESHA